MPFAQVKNSIVQAIAGTAADSTWLSCGPLVQVGWTFSNSAFSPAPKIKIIYGDWYWIVAGSTTQVYSSAAANYISPSDTTYQAWLAQGNTTSAIPTQQDLQALLTTYYPLGWIRTPAQIAAKAAATALAQGILISSVVTPAINANYATDVGSVANVNAVMTYILSNNAFPNNADSLSWADSTGAMHTFPTTAVFKNFATAFANYVTAVSIFADSGGTIGSIPSNQVAIA